MFFKYLTIVCWYTYRYLNYINFYIHNHNHNNNNISHDLTVRIIKLISNKNSISLNVYNYIAAPEY